MENNIKNIHRIKPYLNEKQIEILEQSGHNYKRFARIYFKILGVEEECKRITIQIHQEKNPHGNYANSKRLIEIAEEVFRDFFKDWQLRKVPIEYIQSPPEIVTSDWVRKKMFEKRITNKQMVKDLGIAKAEISALINGHVDMSQRTKAMFYYYFKTIEEIISA